MAIEQTLILIKPDGAKRRLTGLTIDRLEAAGLTLAGAKVISVSEDLAKEHYAFLKDKPFFPNLIRYIRGEFHSIRDSRILAMVWEGEGAVALVRKIAGATNPEEAAPGTIRGSFGRITTDKQFENVIHASGNAEEAEREVKIWFKPSDIVGAIYPAKNGVKADVKVWA